MSARSIRSGGVAALICATAGLSACGGGSQAPPPGSPERPLVAHRQEAPAKNGARTNESSSPSVAQAPANAGYAKLLKNQSRHPRSRFTPCNLVTAAQARAIVGAPMQDPVEAPQGPTCIYRSRDGKSFVSLAVQPLDIAKVKPRVRLRHRVAVSNRAGFCGTYGQPMLYVPLSRGRVLSVAGQCEVAKRFAIKAVRQLSPTGR